MNLNNLSQTVHAADKKWWQDIETGTPIKRNKGELLALVHSELSECYDGMVADMMDDKLPHRQMAEVELADAIIRLLDYSAGFSHDIGSFASSIGLGELNSMNDIGQTPQVVISYREVQLGGVSFLHSRLSRILESERKGRMEQAVEEIVLSIVAICMFAELSGYDMQRTIDEKMAFNAQREDHKHEARRIAGGKQF